MAKNTIRIFVASSTEGAPVAHALRKALQAELGGGRALVELWSHKFEYGDTAIEALEAVAEHADFAVVVMTPDDKTSSREDIDQPAPRDNLVFELGLFIGALGRERSIVARDFSDALKVPSDILSVTALSFDSASPDSLDVSLQAECVRLAERIEHLGPRPKWLAEGRRALAANAEFSASIAGTWWEKSDQPDGSRLSFFTITADPLAASVTLDGTTYGHDGVACADWKSEMARLYLEDRRLTYLWRGKHLQPGFANLKFHGYGTMEFSPADASTGLVARGGGDFWVVDEAQPANTVMKPIELRRVVDPTQLDCMTSGRLDAKQATVVKALHDW